MVSEDFDTFLVSLCDYLNMQEEAIKRLKEQIAKLVGVTEPKLTKREWGWNPDKIKWENAEGSSGQYQKSEDFNNPEFKAMLKDLQAHNGKLTRDGYFYWVYRNGSTVGRKKRGVL